MTNPNSLLKLTACLCILTQIVVGQVFDGSDSNDDTIAFNNLSAIKARITAPAGNYYFTNTLYLSNNIVEGDGIGATRFIFSQKSQWAFIIACNSQLKNILLTSIYTNGLGTYSSDTFSKSSRAICVTGNNNVFEDVKIEFAGDGIYSFGTFNNRINRFQAENIRTFAGDGLVFDILACNAWSVTHSVFKNNDGIYLSRWGGGNHLVFDLYATNTFSSGFAGQPPDYYGGGPVIEFDTMAGKGPNINNLALKVTSIRGRGEFKISDNAAHNSSDKVINSGFQHFLIKDSLSYLYQRPVELDGIDSFLIDGRFEGSAPYVNINVFATAFSKKAKISSVTFANESYLNKAIYAQPGSEDLTLDSLDFGHPLYGNDYVVYAYGSKRFIIKNSLFSMENSVAPAIGYVYLYLNSEDSTISNNNVLFPESNKPTYGFRSKAINSQIYENRAFGGENQLFIRLDGPASYAKIYDNKDYGIGTARSIDLDEFSFRNSVFNNWMSYSSITIRNQAPPGNLNSIFDNFYEQ